MMRWVPSQFTCVTAGRITKAKAFDEMGPFTCVTAGRITKANLNEARTGEGSGKGATKKIRSDLGVGNGLVFRCVRISV